MSGSIDNTADLLACARRLNMFASGGKVLAGVSGGADSVAMLHALHISSHELNISLHVCHVNHMLRKTAGRDQLFVENLCRALDIPCTVCKADVPSMLNSGGGVEETARIARYNLLLQTADNISAKHIAVAHTADDVVETLLHNIVRGTGIEGLASIKPIRDKIARPILDAYRADVERYLAEHNLSYVDDETNTDTTYTRNRIRHQLIPHLAESYNPAVLRALKRLADIALDASAYISAQAVSAAEQISDGGEFSVSAFTRLPPALQYEIIRTQIAIAKGDAQDITFEQVHRIVEALHSDADFQITLSGGEMHAYRHLEVFGFRSVHPPEPHRFHLQLPVPGELAIPGIGVTLTARILPVPASLKVPKDIALLDMDAVIGKIIVRNPQPGDRIVPFGMTGTKKLQDLFVDAHIPARDRGSWPVVTDSQKIIWVPHLAASNLCAVSKSTQKVLQLNIFSTPS